MARSLSRARNSTIRRAGHGQPPAASPPHAHGHTATLLPNGQVLVAGGGNTDSGSALASAELYDPASGTWTATGSLVTARLSHTATLLPNGQVLVAGGGNSSSGTLASAELYDPASGTWTATGSLVTRRTEHLATLLPNGQVLVAEGFNTDGAALASAELYDPASGTWDGDRQHHCRHWDIGGTATLLPDGKVLDAGGSLSLPPGASDFAELYDPASGAWTATGRLTTDTHSSHGDVAARRPGARRRRSYLFKTSTYLASAELYDPASGAWTATGRLATRPCCSHRDVAA